MRFLIFKNAEFLFCHPHLFVLECKKNKVRGTAEDDHGRKQNRGGRPAAPRCSFLCCARPLPRVPLKCQFAFKDKQMAIQDRNSAFFDNQESPFAPSPHSAFWLGVRVPCLVLCQGPLDISDCTSCGDPW